MKINKLTASFGKLENETLTLNDGLNVIAAPNESGKSTWCAFITAMLYGIDSSQRAKVGYLPDKQRYAPWSGAPMEGTMELTAGGKNITLIRTTRTKSAPMRDFSAVYTGSNVKVDGLTSTNVGEQLTGVTREVYHRSAFIPQGTLTVSGSPELEKRITEIVATGEERTSYSEADEQLRAWQRKRRWNRKGILPELESKIDETRRKLEDMGGSLDDIGELEKRLETTKQECTRLENAVNDSRQRQRREALDTLAACRTENTRCSEQHDRALEALDDSKDALRASAFGMADEDEVAKRTEEDLKKLAELKAAVQNKPKPYLAILAFVLSALCAAAITLLDSWVFMILAAAFCVGAILLLFRYIRQKRAIETLSEERAEILRKYNARGSKDVQDAAADHRALWQAVHEAEQAERRARTACEVAAKALAEVNENTLQGLDFACGSSEAAVLSRQLSAKRAAAEDLSRQIAGRSGRLAAMGDPLVLASFLGCMQEEHDTVNEEYDALTVAIETMREADTEIQGRFSPELGKVAAGYMSLVTGGKYADVMINRDFSAMTRTSSDTVARPAEYLSAGTLDLMYLAVRLAVCEMALPKGESCPLVIDDALVNLDEERTAQAMELLREIARTRQVILFSCKKV